MDFKISVEKLARIAGEAAIAMTILHSFAFGVSAVFATSPTTETTRTVITDATPEIASVVISANATPGTLTADSDYNSPSAIIGTQGPLTLTAGSTLSAYVHIIAKDWNGWQDIDPDSADPGAIAYTGYLKHSAVGTCLASNGHDCYMPFSFGNCTLVAHGTYTAQIRCAVSLTSNTESGTWNLSSAVTDRGAESAAFTGSFVVNPLLASSGGSGTGGPGTVTPSFSGITNVNATNITTSSARITWMTDGSSDSRVDYGLTDAYGMNVSDGSNTTAHLLPLSGLIPNTVYHYRVRSNDSAGKAAFSVDRTFTTLVDTTPPANVFGLIALPGDSRVSLSWTNPTDQDFAGVIIRRKTGGFPANATDGVMAYSGTGSTVDDLTVTNGILYYYGVFAFDAVPNYSSGALANATPVGPPDHVTPGSVINFTAVGGDGEVQLSWTNPSDLDFQGVKIVRKLGSFPTSRTDGTLVYDGNSSSKLDTGLSNGTTYFYGAYAYDSAQNIAQGAFANGTPTATPQPPASCSDSDGGHAYDVVGTVSVKGAPVGTDTCSNAESLIEMYCEGSVARTENHSCGDGYQCNAGKCEIVPQVQNSEMCGNGICAGSENSLNCPQDCPVVPTNTPVPVPMPVPVPVPVPTVPPGSGLSANDLRFYATAAKIQLRMSPGEVLQFYRNAAFTVMIPDISIRKPVKDAFVNLNGAGYAMRPSGGYEATITTPDQGGSVPLDVIIEYQDDTKDVVHVTVALKNRGFGYEDASGNPALEGARVTMYVDNGGGNFGFWDGSSSGQANPQVTGAGGSFAYIVPEGSYKIVVEQDGYGTVTTLSFPNTDENVITKSIGLLRLPQPLKLNNPRSIADNAAFVAKVALKAAQGVTSNPYVQQQINTVAVPAATIATVANVASIGVATASAIPYLLYLWSLLTHPFLLIARRRRKQWGIVYDSLTKRPIDLAIVRLTDATTGRTVRSAVSDRDGRYFFIVQKGTYRMEAVKVGHAFPTGFLKDEKEDANYIDLYHGEEIDVANETTITANIPLDPVSASRTPSMIILEGIARRFQKSVGILAIIAMLTAAIITPTLIMFAMLLANVVLYLTFRRLAVTKKPKNWGIVYDEKTKKPLGNVIARIFDTRFNKLLESQVTDIRGRYAFLVGKSTYYVTFEKPGYQKQQRGPAQLTDEAKSAMKVVAEDVSLSRNFTTQEQP